MFTVDANGRIETIKGDTGIIELALDDYQLKDGDKVYFTVKSNYESERLIFKEVTKFADGKVKFIFTPEDTNINVGTYLYDVQCNLKY